MLHTVDSCEQHWQRIQRRGSLGLSMSCRDTNGIQLNLYHAAAHVLSFCWHHELVCCRCKLALGSLVWQHHRSMCLAATAANGMDSIGSEPQQPKEYCLGSMLNQIGAKHCSNACIRSSSAVHWRKSQTIQCWLKPVIMHSSVL